MLENYIKLPNASGDGGDNPVLVQYMEEKIFAICNHSKLAILDMDLKIKKRTGQEIVKEEFPSLILVASDSYIAHNGDIDGEQKVTVFYRNLKKVLVSIENKKHLTFNF